MEILRVGPDDVVLGVLPLFHALAQMANLLLPLSAGARVVFLESVNSTTLLDALQTRGITAFACVPQFFYLIHERVMRDVSGRGRIGRAIFRGVLAGNIFAARPVRCGILAGGSLRASIRCSARACGFSLPADRE